MRTLLTRLGLGALVGLLSAGVAVGVGELVAAFVRPEASPIIAVGNRFVLLTPEWLKEYAIRRFGSNDKQMLLLGIYVVVALLAVVVGVLATRRLLFGIVGLVLFGAIGVWSAATADATRGTDVIPSIVAALAGLATLVLLTRLRERAVGRATAPATTTTPSDGPAPADSATADDTTADDTTGDGVRTARPGSSRRIFLLGGLAAAALAAVTGFGGRRLQHLRFDANRSRSAVALPRPASPAGPLPNGVDLGKGAVPFLTSNNDFYRVDTALTVPQVPADTWRLRIHGMVDRELTLSFDDLLRRPMIERYITMTCVSDAVGGPYVSTAKFLGVPLGPLLKELGVHAGADQIVGTSVDGMTIGTPTSVIMDGRDAMLAVGMNDEPLPLAHGFPCRMLVPGLYGYVSATKWLVDLEATTFDSYDTYWVKRNWAPQAPIRLESRIDSPRGLSTIKAGQRVNIAGIAWHQHVGIKAVQVRIAGGEWHEARLGRVPSSDTWVQWVYPWIAEGSGPTTLEVRAIDADGVVQEQKRRGVFPSGASGWHSIVVIVT